MVNHYSSVGAVYSLGTVSGLNDDERLILDELYRCWNYKLTRNILRAQYYDHKNLLKNLGIAIPPHLAKIDIALGWPAKAVDVLARRCKFERFTTPKDGGGDPLEIVPMLNQNDFMMELPQAITSTFVHSCSFITLSQGEVSLGEPEVMINTQSAMFGSGLWDYRRRRLRAAFSVTSTDEWGRVLDWLMFIPGVTIRGRWDRKWEIERYYHTLDRLPVEVLPYQPRLDRPFGKSRISRSVMGLTDSALRTLVRMEIGAEFYSSPQRWIMGADETMFTDAEGNPVPQWQSLAGRIWAAPADEEGNLPQVGQFNAATPIPHTEQLRSLAAMFCAETSLPLNELGIIHDNPASAEAIEAAERSLIIEANFAMDSCLGPRLVRAIQTALQIREGWDVLPPEVERLAARWSPPENTPKSAATDAMTKLVTSMPHLAKSPIPLEELGWDDATIQRAMADMDRVESEQPTQDANPVSTDETLVGE
ncbi:portal protein [Mycobacterium phage Gaia]|uniref:Portal protein n=1 Tax=Mycobacterium phage Gaia TaxID=1486472 RepID=A0A068F3B8_9CAUD|nr:portal protein [Mycobacterium phage Gaia]AID58823.1 portal protein [Mycobacterium phage Gaia]AYQ99945.1 portal protein [Mycobacterium phage Nebkiss]